MEQFVTKDTFLGRQQIVDERFARDKERIEAQEKAMQEVRTLTVQMGEILKKYSETQESHGDRIGCLERQPIDQYSKIKLVLATAVISGIIGSIITAVAASMKP